MRVLVTGGAGFIGSQTCLELLRSGHQVYVIDSLDNGNIEALKRVKWIANREFGFGKFDVRDRNALNEVFSEFQPNAVIHLAGLKAVGESVIEPAKYFDVNVVGTEILLRSMEQANCQNIVFSSSATVYGRPQYLPCDEHHPLNPDNPYGRSKVMGEELLRNWSNRGNDRHAVALRYFNPVGADASGQIGEDPNGVPSNLMPYVAQVAIGRLGFLRIFGDDYDTVDGTGVRDYVHVVDVALAHIAAVEQIHKLSLFEPINIGTGNGISVLELVNEFQKQSGQKVSFQIAPRRTGDAAAVWADVSNATKKLGFKTKRGFDNMCLDTWRWQSQNPIGYRKTIDLI